MATRSLLLAAGLTGVAIAAAGCSSSSSTPATSPTAAPTEAPSQLPSEAPTPTAKPTKTESGSGSMSMPKAPAGAKMLSNHKTSGSEYARYKIAMAPKQVVNKYKKQAKNNGYTIENSGGSGGGWGGWGGSDYGMTAKKSGMFEDVQAGGESGGPTYYEVCIGTEERGYDHCEQRSQDDHRDSDSRGS